MDRKTISGCLIAALLFYGLRQRAAPIVVGSKNFTEQVVLGEIVAQHLEHRLKEPVKRKLRSQRYAAGASGPAKRPTSTCIPNTPGRPSQIS